jgi:sugar lactone lactonase YvrE
MIPAFLRSSRVLQTAIILSVAAFLAACASTMSTAKKPEEKKSSVLPDYPRVNLAPHYEVDPKWPQKPATAKIGHVPGVAVDAQDNVWIFTRAMPPVQVYAADGRYIRGWGETTVSNAHHIKLDRDGSVWLADVGLHVVRKFTRDGAVLLTIGTPGLKGEDATHLNMPTDMAIAANGDVFISDGYANSRVAHFDRNGKFIKAWGTLGVGPENFSIPHAIAIDSKGRLYVADRNNVRIQTYSQEGKLLDSWRDVIVPWGFWMTEKDELWVCGSSPMPWENHPKYPGAPLSCPPKDQVLMRFNTDGKLLQLWTAPKAEDGKEKPGELNWVHGLALDSKGNIYCGDIIGKRAQKFVRKN